MTERNSGMAKDGGREFEAQVEANMTLLLQAMEGISKRLDERKIPPDHGETIGELAKTATELVEQANRIAASEALKSTPKAHAKMMDEAAARVAEQGRENVEDARRTLGAATESVRETRKHARHPYDQKAWNWGFAATGVVVSAMLWFLATAHVIHPAYSIWPYRMTNPDSLWRLGWNFASRGDPEVHKLVVKAFAIYRDNSDALAACEDAARRSGTSAQCRILVAAPE